jgi:hypothetical protein
MVVDHVEEMSPAMNDPDGLLAELIHTLGTMVSNIRDELGGLRDVLNPQQMLSFGWFCSRRAGTLVGGPAS